MGLQGKHLVLDLTNGIACYESVELVWLLTKAGMTIQVMMTRTVTHSIMSVAM